MNTVKEYKVNDEKGAHEYNIIVEETDELIRFTLSPSPHSDWTHTGPFVTLVDDGNNLTFDKLSKKLDYDDALFVRILLNFNNYYAKSKGNTGEYFLVEEKIITQL